MGFGSDDGPIGVFRVGDAFWAIEDTCTHGRASMSEGELDGTWVVCPFHGGCVDVTTGEPTAGPITVPAKTYRTKVIDGGVYVEIPSSPRTA